MYETKKERHEVYKAALETLQKQIKNYDPAWVDGLCFHLFRTVNYQLDFKGIKNTFIEFISFCPDSDMHEYWWSRDAKGNQKRVEVLKKCIEMTAP